MLPYALLFAAVGLLICALAVPLLRRRVRPNSWYGLRVPATFADEAVWYEANARSGWDLLRLGLFVLALALALAIVPGLSAMTYVGTLGAVLVGGAVVTGVVGFRRANRLLAQQRK